ncbi:MAG: HPr-rel-A system PqqD family protein [Ignavibacteriae bacterium HGW-Ignavibacteriae-3]|nr:MAG: HPr-rel-A system PqqD family protein [Ignavibacteriae bacterium HGW-Ignavibacteriae-3]
MLNISIPKNLAVSDSGFLFLTSTGETFTLNEIGHFIFKQFQQNGTLEDVKKKVVQEYDVDPASLEKDLDDFIGQLKAYNLVETK